LRADAAQSAPPPSIAPTRCCTAQRFAEDAGQALDLPLRCPHRDHDRGSARRRFASAPFGRSFATSSISGWPT